MAKQTPPERIWIQPTRTADGYYVTGATDDLGVVQYIRADLCPAADAVEADQDLDGVKATLTELRMEFNRQWNLKDSNVYTASREIAFRWYLAGRKSIGELQPTPLNSTGPVCPECKHGYYDRDRYGVCQHKEEYGIPCGHRCITSTGPAQESQLTSLLPCPLRHTHLEDVDEPEIRGLRVITTITKEPSHFDGVQAVIKCGDCGLTLSASGLNLDATTNRVRKAWNTRATVTPRLKCRLCGHDNFPEDHCEFEYPNGSHCGCHCVFVTPFHSRKGSEGFRERVKRHGDFHGSLFLKTKHWRTTMEWTKDKPETDGWYWYRHNPERFPDLPTEVAAPLLLMVYHDATRFQDTVNSLFGSEINDNMDGLWAGPILPPEFAPAAKQEHESVLVNYADCNSFE